MNRMRVKRVGADQIKTKPSNFGTPMLADRLALRVVVVVTASLAALLHGVERLRCPPVAKSVDVLRTTDASLPP